MGTTRMTSAEWVEVSNRIQKLRIKAIVQLALSVGMLLNIVLLQIRTDSLSHNGIIVGTVISGLFALVFAYAAGINTEKWRGMLYGQ